MSDEPKFRGCATPLLQEPQHSIEAIDIWRSAAILLKQYGADEGERIAARRAAALLDQGERRDVEPSCAAARANRRENCVR